MCDSLDSLRVTVMGLGHHGGGLGVVTWLLDQGATVVITDMASQETLSESLKVLRDHPRAGDLSTCLGGHEITDFTDTDLVVVNPGVPHPWSNPFLQAACRHGVAVTTEIRLLLDRLGNSRTIGITGSVGKSTTAAMVHHIFQHVGITAHFGGNIGGTLLHSINEIKEDDWVIVELSSFMLHWLNDGMGEPDARGWSPTIAVMTSIEPNHLDWHETFDHYKACKERIFAFQPRGGVQIHPDHDTPWPDDAPLAIPGRHNRENAARAVEITRAAGIPTAHGIAALASFAGLPHRLFRVPTDGGFDAFDDSKASTPTATCRAVASFDDLSRVHLIAGGYDKGSDLTPIVDHGASLGGVYAIGATAPSLVAAGIDHGVTVLECGTLHVAVATAVGKMGKGDVLLLSPGCASWDQFRDFRQRGETFAALVKEARVGS